MTGAGGFEVSPHLLARYGRATSVEAAVLAAEAAAVPEEFLGRDAFGGVRRSAALQRAYLDFLETTGDKLRAASKDTDDLAAGARASADGYAGDDDLFASWFGRGWG